MTNPDRAIPRSADAGNISALAEIRAIAVIALPLAAAYLAEIAMMVCDRIIVGRLGGVELAAVGLVGDLAFETLLFAMAVVSVVGVVIAQSTGAGDSAPIANQVRQGLWVATGLAVPGTAILWHLGPLLSLTAQDPAVIRLGDDYARALAWCFLPSLWFIVLRQLLAARARANAVMAITVVAVFVNAGLTWALVFGRFGLPALGVAGAGWATALVSWAMFAALAFHVARAPGLAEFGIFTDLRVIDTALWREILRLGLPVGGLALLEGGMFAVVAVLMGTLGAETLAANQIVVTVATFGLVIAIAIGEATAVRVAHAVGRGISALPRKCGFLGLAAGLAVMSVSATAFVILPRPITSIFIDTADPANAAVVAIAAQLLIIAAVFQLADGTQAIASRALRGLKDTTAPMWIAAVGYWGFGVTGGYVLCFPLGLGATGLWWGLALGLTVTAALLTWRFGTISPRAT
jgi:MATE family multidrug resistance protein